jgi:hypothetical protein
MVLPPVNFVFCSQRLPLAAVQQDMALHAGARRFGGVVDREV